MKVLYFAWLRQKLGRSEEAVDPPAGVATVTDLLDWLQARSPAHADALANRAVLRVAVNQEFARPDQPIAASDEIALFPPMTGG